MLKRVQHDSISDVATNALNLGMTVNIKHNKSLRSLGNDEPKLVTGKL